MLILCCTSKYDKTSKHANFKMCILVSRNKSFHSFTQIVDLTFQLLRLSLSQLFNNHDTMWSVISPLLSSCFPTSMTHFLLGIFLTLMNSVFLLSSHYHYFSSSLIISCPKLLREFSSFFSSKILHSNV